MVEEVAGRVMKEMKILDDLLSTINRDAQVKDIRIGTFQSAILTQGCGLASTPTVPDHAHHQGKALVREAGALLEKGVLELAQMAYSKNLLEATIGMATINSLLEIDEGRCLELNAGDLLTEKGKDKRVALIGHFPFVPKLRQTAKELWVIEKQPQEGDFPEDKAEVFVPRADVVGITGTAFTNHTVEHLLGLCRPESYVVILGGTTPLSPVLFDYGVDTISGTKVVDPEAVLRCVSQGATFRQIRGIRLLTMER